jgi:deoxyadenosine/deoxycytidine kinase
MKIPILPSSGLVVIIGYAATGKTHLMNDLKSKYNAHYWSTDDYMGYGFEEALYVIMQGIDNSKASLKVIEGVQGYRLLRKLAQLSKPLPDMVIECVASKEVRQIRIAARGKNVQATLNLDKVLSKVYEDFKLLAPNPKYKYVRYETK